VNISPAEAGLQMRIVADEQPEVDLWGARRRTGFFEKVFGVPLSISWQPRQPAAAAADAPPPGGPSSGDGNSHPRRGKLREGIAEQ
jgi:hypothetical protein